MNKKKNVSNKVKSKKDTTYQPIEEPSRETLSYLEIQDPNIIRMIKKFKEHGWDNNRIAARLEIRKEQLDKMDGI